MIDPYSLYPSGTVTNALDYEGNRLEAGTQVWRYDGLNFPTNEWDIENEILKQILKHTTPKQMASTLLDEIEPGDTWDRGLVALGALLGRINGLGAFEEGL
ncbi:hypothetical protein [Secundilactobacillus kimchicus]|uniref:Uncharacterized protein n=1 Tax=Secundilactobacillus kimchicus JCM 15530 TaxID=1302272 RepID=A0A0R1HP05_9LACO|nr:hypothetical protein [Secundilactobacillus kimchicus]KRK48168.1 hypothetical protein FC96_GL001904 [Secundilactobacillus kimchicus JCM 15530]